MEESGPRRSGRDEGWGGGWGCVRGHEAALPGEAGVGEKLEEQEGSVFLKNPGSRSQCGI